MIEYHKNHDIFLISSDVEGGTPLVVLEAMAGGLPVIGSDAPGIRELIKDTGILVKQPYAQNFAKTIEDLWETPEKLNTLSKQSTEKIKPYTWDKFIEKLEEIYSEILE